MIQKGFLKSIMTQLQFEDAMQTLKAKFDISDKTYQEIKRTFIQDYSERNGVDPENLANDNFGASKKELGIGNNRSDLNLPILENLNVNPVNETNMSETTLKYPESGNPFTDL